MGQSLMGAVTDSVQGPEGDSGSGMFNVDAGVFDGFDARLENLHWKETDDGVLFVGNDQFAPDHLVSIRVDGGELEVETVEDPDDAPWRQMRTISTPDTAATPQYD